MDADELDWIREQLARPASHYETRQLHALTGIPAHRLRRTFQRHNEQHGKFVALDALDRVLPGFWRAVAARLARLEAQIEAEHQPADENA